MQDNQSPTQTNNPKSQPLPAAIKITFSMACIIALFFLPAGRWDWWQAWALVGSFLIYTTILFIWLKRRDPQLLAERRQAGPNVKKWDRILINIYTYTLLIMFLVASLDAGRYYWSKVPLLVDIIGWIGVALAMAIIWWVMDTNTFLSSMVRIQKDRSHQVISSGPYHFIRHPMYVGIIISIISIPLVLESWWAMIPAIIIVGIFIIRTNLEDQTLRQELEGYQQYAEKVRFRLVPGIW